MTRQVFCFPAGVRCASGIFLSLYNTIAGSGNAGFSAIDHGADVLIAVDFDGQARPFGPGFDIGYDEFTGAVILPRVYIPLVLQ